MLAGANTRLAGGLSRLGLHRAAAGRAGAAQKYYGKRIDAHKANIAALDARGGAVRNLTSNILAGRRDLARDRAGALKWQKKDYEALAKNPNVRVLPSEKRLADPSGAGRRLPIVGGSVHQTRAGGLAYKAPDGTLHVVKPSEMQAVAGMLGQYMAGRGGAAGRLGGIANQGMNALMLYSLMGGGGRSAAAAPAAAAAQRATTPGLYGNAFGAA